MRSSLGLIRSQGLSRGSDVLMFRPPRSYSQALRFALHANSDGECTSSAVVVDWLGSGRVATGERWAFREYKSCLEFAWLQAPVPTKEKIASFNFQFPSWVAPLRPSKEKTKHPAIVKTIQDLQNAYIHKHTDQVVCRFSPSLFFPLPSKRRTPCPVSRRCLVRLLRRALSIPSS